MEKNYKIQENVDLSIIVPVYNIEKFLRQCIESLINQTLKTIEIILIDDGSTDNSGDICDEYAKMDNRIVVIHQKNKGASYSRNVGLKIAKGEWITFVDSDDWVENDLYEVAMKELKEKELDMIMFNYYNEYSKNSKPNVKIPSFNFTVKGKEIRKLQLCILDTRALDIIKIYTEEGKCENFNFKNNIWAGMPYLWNKIFKKSLIKENELEIPLQNFKHVIYEDGMFCYKYFNKANKIRYINKYLYHHRRLNNSLMQSFNSDIIPICNYLMEEYYMEEKKQNSLELQYVYIKAIRNLREICFLYLFNKKNTKSLKEKKKEFKQLIDRPIYQETFNNLDISQLGKSYRYYFKFAKNKNYMLLCMYNNLEKLMQYLIILKNKTKFYK